MQLAKVSYRSPQVGKAIAQSLQQTGFAILCDHEIPVETIQFVYQEWRSFFASAAKHDYLHDIHETNSQAGYFPMLAEHAKDYGIADLKEFFHVYQRQDLPTQISHHTWQLFNDLLNLAKEILGWIEIDTPQVFPDQLESLQQMIAHSPNHLLRILHYPPLTGSEQIGAVRAAAHQDINLITLLPAATHNGLQVQDLEGHWYEVPCCLGEIVINVGDMLQVASGGYYRSTTHRVVNPIGLETGRSRYSMPLFLHAHPASIISTTGLTAGTYLAERLQQIGILG
ncbi:2OG-Fe(II) oxygenase [Thalassoporum mexicanum PCC 7367]|uniref:isopenicillin N synthase family dioxygenase n=1 Tax=Thalassoporum mexicanum TaxID=3457544 RepID=UPI00029FC05B|nr:2OG-Fe(II) oxygenase family protein [Pseudanabaena sp. PCC 7367]AFY70937.1 2OG-Fe(II) oxygenase [Pseudanabaena sp. PCC 7367]